jgi:cytochrome c553
MWPFAPAAIAALAAALSLPPYAQAMSPGDPAAGAKLARMCAVCHGKDGVAVRPHTPNIAGQDEGYLSEQLADYRSGERVHPEMNVVAASLNDAQIADLAAYFAAQEMASD